MEGPLLTPYWIMFSSSCTTFIGIFFTLLLHNKSVAIVLLVYNMPNELLTNGQMGFKRIKGGAV